MSNQKSILNVYKVQQTANATADAYGRGDLHFTVEPSDAANLKKEGLLSKKGKNVTIRIPKADASGYSVEDMSKIRGHTYRSVLRYTDGQQADAYLADKKLGEKHKGVFSIVEGSRLEVLGSKRYFGDRQDFSHEVIRSAHYQQQVYKYTEGQKLDRDTAGMLAVNLAALASRSHLSPDAYVAARDALANAPQEVIEAYAKLKDAELHRFSEADDADESIDRTDKIIKLLFDDDDEPQGGEGEGEDGEGDGDSDEGEGDPKDGKGKSSKGKGGKGKDPSKAMQKLASLANHADKWEPGEPGGCPVPKTDSTYNLTPLKDITTYVCQTNKFLGTPMERARQRIEPAMAKGQPMPTNGYWDRGGIKLGSNSKAFANRVRQLLQVRSASQWQGGHTSGKVNRSAMYRLTVPCVGDGEWNSRVFRKRIESDMLDVSIEVLLDASGSMRGGGKDARAVESAILLNESISRVLHIPIEITAFTDFDWPAHIIVKQFDEKVTSDEVQRRTMLAYDCMSSNNADADAVLWGVERLRPRKEKRKILFVMSDGAPANTGSGYGRDGSGVHRGHISSAFQRKVVETIEKSGEVEVYALSLMDNSAKQYYKNCIHVDSAEKLPTAILDTLKKIIVNEDLIGKK